MGMFRSLFVKLAMLAASIGLVCWIGWLAPADFPIPAMSDGEVSAGAAHRFVTEEPTGSRFDRVTARPVSAKTGTAQRAKARARDESASNDLLDLNRADATDFESLPGIGPVLAQRVIDYRTTVGRFQRIDDLRAVKGIGPKIFERIKPLVTVAAEDGKGKAEKQL